MSPVPVGFLVCLFAASINAANWTELHVKWSLSGLADHDAGNAYFTMPLTANEALTMGWEEIESDSEYWNIWCLPGDPRLCILTAKSGSTIGLDISVLTSDVSDTPYDMSIHPYFVLEKRYGVDIYRARVFWVDSEEVKAGGRPNTEDGFGDTLLLQHGNNQVKVPTTANEIASETLYVEENCIPGMGKHYYYNVTKELECEYFEPYFALTDVSTGELIGFGLQAFGTYSNDSRTWFEDIPYYAIQMTVPTAPTCMSDWVKEYGIISVHVYLKPEPWNIGCAV